MVQPLNQQKYSIFELLVIFDAITNKELENVLNCSERADPTSQYNKGRLKEGANINKSLVTLGNVIQALGKVFEK